MRIDYNKYPMIDLIGKGVKNENKIGSHGYFRGELLNELLIKEAPRVYVLSNSFLSAIESIEDKLDYIISEQLPKDGLVQESGVLLIGGATVLFRIYEAGLYSFCFVGHNQQGFMFTPFNKETAYLSMLTSYNNDAMRSMNKSVIAFLCFKKYAEVSEKVIKKKSGSEAFNFKYVNNTNKNITVMDSTWFTTLIQTEGFNVRGHFRLQPVGEGRKERKLIWINDFQKNGYVREAGKLKHEASGHI